MRTPVNEIQHIQGVDPIPCQENNDPSEELFITGSGDYRVGRDGELQEFFTAAIQVPLNIPRKKKGIRRILTGNSPIGPLDLNGMRQLPKIKRNPPA